MQSPAEPQCSSSQTGEPGEAGQQDGGEGGRREEEGGRREEGGGRGKEEGGRKRERKQRENKLILPTLDGSLQMTHMTVIVAHGFGEQ